jgi:hypothetical protein
MNRITATLLCLVLCLAGTSISTASAASRLTSSSSTALTSCLQQEYLKRDTYQNVFAQYPTLTAFATVITGDVTMITTVKKVFAQYGITVPTDAKISAAKTVAATVTGISNADAVAISLERSTVTLMTQLSRTTDNRDVANAVAFVKTASLGSNTAAFTAEQASVAIPALTTPSQRIVSFTTSDTGSTFLNLLADETVDVIEMAAGTYALPEIDIDVNRTRLVVVRPAPNATVIMSGAKARGNPQFMFGFNGTAGNITMQNFVFDGFVLAQQGIVQGFNCHDITLNGMTVRNSRCNGTSAQPYQSWAIYLTASPTVVPTNFTANGWTVDGSARRMGMLQVYGGNHITATGWSVSNAYYAVYASGSRGPLSDLVLDNWSIANSGAPAWGYTNVSVAMEDLSGRFSNMQGTASGVLKNVGSPRMTDGGGNSI